ncbi:MAG TPA: hypothetical protein VFQ53_00845 [Kofleriaceae bacterium]|nr:hypothetical protein [Kofleriaceae bacterium]
MRRVAVCALLAASACGRSQGVPDEALGGLVIEPKPAAKVDVERAAQDPDELSRALAVPHDAVVAALGPHAFAIKTKTVVEEGGKVVEELSDETKLELGDRGAYHGVYSNSADYGREALYLPGPKADTKPDKPRGPSGTLYLRPRYQRWHMRAPETEREPDEIRDAYFGAIAATWDLLAPGAELTDKGALQVAGRAARKIEIKQAPSPRELPKESLSQRRWREGRTIEGVSGEVILDADKAVPLAVKLTGTVGFVRDGRRFAMKISLDASITSIGTVAQLAAPPEAEVVTTPGRLGEVDERDFLLQGIAPSIRKNPDGTAIAPAIGSGSDAGDKKPDKKPEPKPDAKSDKKANP